MQVLYGRLPHEGLERAVQQHALKCRPTALSTGLLPRDEDILSVVCNAGVCTICPGRIRCQPPALLNCSRGIKNLYADVVAISVIGCREDDGECIALHGQ